MIIPSLFQYFSNLTDDFVFNFLVFLYHPEEPYTIHNYLVDKLMNNLDSFPETFLIPEVQEPQGLPYKRRNHESKQCRLCCFFKSFSKGNKGKVRIQSSRVIT